MREDRYPQLLVPGLSVFLLIVGVLFPAPPVCAGRRPPAREHVRKVLAPDAIPAIKFPQFIDAARAQISPDEPVIGLSLNGDHRAYSVYLLNSHEVVNDVVGGIPVAVTWCPLVNLVAVYDRRSKDRSDPDSIRSDDAGKASEIKQTIRTFGVSGDLLRNTLVMFDYTTGSLWPSMTGKAIEGSQADLELERVAGAQMIRWDAWRRTYPDSRVLTVGGLQSPGFDSYHDYHKSLLKTGIGRVRNKDHRLKPKTTVIALDIDGRYKAYSFDLFEKTKLLSDDFAGLPLLLYHDKVTGSSAVYSRWLDEEEVEVEFDELKTKAFARDTVDLAVDRATGTKWDLRKGEGVEGPYQGARLEPLPFMTVYWFAWADYHPKTKIYE